MAVNWDFVALEVVELVVLLPLVVVLLGPLSLGLIVGGGELFLGVDWGVLVEELVGAVADVLGGL